MSKSSITNLSSALVAASTLFIVGCETVKTDNVKADKVQAIPQKAESPKATVYTIKPGDTFYSIARKVYGEPKYWKTIFEANKDVHPNPNALMIGQELKLPVIEKPKEVKKPVVVKAPPTPAPQKAELPKMIKLTKSEIMDIGKRIYKNECGGSTQYLTVWNKGEAFPSFGLGHFIWYPKGVEAKFVETFPTFVEFAQEKGAVLPPPLVPSPDNFDAPWTDRNDFMHNINHRNMIMIRHFLANHIALQTEFIINRSENALGEILKDLTAEKREDISTKYYKIANSKGGMYPLIDYVNFKGEGTSPKERYKQQGWGLLQVLEQMKPDTKIGDETIYEFVRSARFILELRVINSPAENNEMQWLPGWKNRLKTYMPSKKVAVKEVVKRKRGSNKIPSKASKKGPVKEAPVVAPKAEMKPAKAQG